MYLLNNFWPTARSKDKTTAFRKNQSAKLSLKTNQTKNCIE